MSKHPKYRRLSTEELKELEPEFIQFLASNGINGQDWVLLKKVDNERVHDIINLFSDLVLEKILNQVRLLEMRLRHEIKMFRFLDDKIVLKGIRISGIPEIDLTTNSEEIDLISLFKSSKGSAQLISAEKKYRSSKEEEAYQLIKAGCLISKNEDLFTSLEKMGTL